MTNEELIVKFNPATSASLTDDDLQLMRQLTDEQIGLLAKAYPNDPHGKPYLLLYDTRLADKKQIYQPSTWQNLNNVRKFSNQKQFMPYMFRAQFAPKRKAPAVGVAGRIAPGKVVDLSATDAAAQLRALQQKQQKQAPAAAAKPMAQKNRPAMPPAAKTVDLKGKKPAGKKAPAAPDSPSADEELQDFSESPEA